MSMIETCPPWALKIRSLCTPLRATEAPISFQTRIRVSALRVRVPGKRWCSLLLPKAWVGSTKAVAEAPIWGKARSTMALTRSVSTPVGRCGPCCSVAATGRTATTWAIWPAARRRAKSRVLRADQWVEGIADMAAS